MSLDVYLFAISKSLMPFSRCKIVVADLILPIPATWKDYILLVIRIFLLKKVHMFISYAKDNRGFECIYHIKRTKFRYVPFKVNNYGEIKKAEPKDEGYIFLGGQTRRDFKTFLVAVDGLSVPIRIVAPGNHILYKHGSKLEDKALPNNIKLVRNATKAPFIRQIAGAKFVVMPIIKKNISPSGISVYLQCMRLKKCVIISSGPSVNGILNDNQAVIVPPEDSKALRQAIIKVNDDRDYRERIAENGYQHAVSLNGETRLNRDIVDTLYEETIKDKYTFRNCR